MYVQQPKWAVPANSGGTTSALYPTMGYQYQPTNVQRQPGYQTFVAPTPTTMQGDQLFGGMNSFTPMYGMQPAAFQAAPAAAFSTQSPLMSTPLGSGGGMQMGRRPPSPPMSPQQQPSDGQGGIEKFKTELCRKFSLTGFCRYGDMCQFAHGPQELRALVRHPLYKTSPCKSFEATGTCRYGARCRFIHDENHHQLATLARGVPALNLQITEPSWEEAQAAALDAVQHLVISSGLSPQGLPVNARQDSPDKGGFPRVPMPDPVSLADLGKPPKPTLSTSPLNPQVDTTQRERSLNMPGRSKTDPGEVSRALSSPPAQSSATGEIRSISSLILINGGNGSSMVSPTHAQQQQQQQMRMNQGNNANGQPKRNASSVKLVVDEDVFPPANLDARRLPVANSGSWVNLAEMASPTASANAPVSPTRYGRPNESMKHSYSQPVLNGDPWMSSFSSDANIRKPTGSIASLPVLPPTSPVNHTNNNNNGRSSALLQGVVNSTSSPNLLKTFCATDASAASSTQQQTNFRKAASYANHIWFESTEEALEESEGGRWSSMARARSVEGRLNIFRNLSDNDLAKTAQNAARAPRLPSFEEKLGEVGLALSEDEDRATDEDRGHDTEEDDGFTLGKF